MSNFTNCQTKYVTALVRY